MNEKIILQGGGEHARVVLDSLLSSGRTVVALFDPKYTGELFGVPQRGAYDARIYPEALAVVAIGNNSVRKRAVSLTRQKFTNVIDQTAAISRFATYGKGNMFLQRTIVQAMSRLGDHVIVNTGAQIDHDCIIEDYVHVAPGVVLCGGVQVGEGTLIGAGAVAIPGTKIGKWAVVGAGAVVTRDLPDYALAVGNPARIVRLEKP